MKSTKASCGVFGTSIRSGNTKDTVQSTHLIHTGSNKLYNNKINNQ